MKRICCVLTLLLPLTATATGPGETEALYQTHCAECHSPDRLGAMGPALLPENLKRLRPKAAVRVIAAGRPATQMLPFKEKLTAAQTQSLVDYIYTPLAEIPPWGMEQIRASRIQHHAPGSLPNQPKFEADLSNLFVVVELGDHHATLLNGDTFEPIHRFPTRFALHGGPKYADNGRTV